MKTESEDERFKETAKLLDYGFNQFEVVELFKAGYKLQDQPSIPVVKGKDEQVEIALKEGISIPVGKGTEDNYRVDYNLDEKLLNENGELVAPVEKGEKVGTAELVFDEGEDFGYILNGEKKISVDLVTTKEVEKKNWFFLMLGAIGDFFAGLYHKFMGLF